MACRLCLFSVYVASIWLLFEFVLCSMRVLCLALFGFHSVFNIVLLGFQFCVQVVFFIWVVFRVLFGFDVGFYVCFMWVLFGFGFGVLCWL